MGAETPFSSANDGLRVALLVSPRASRNRIGGITAEPGGGRLKVAVTAPPEDGKANDAVIALLARAWRRPKRSLRISAGAGARHKTLHVSGEAEELMQRITGKG